MFVGKHADLLWAFLLAFVVVTLWAPPWLSKVFMTIGLLAVIVVYLRLWWMNRSRTVTKTYDGHGNRI